MPNVFSHQSHGRPTIDMTPMIDCCFQLLIFFLLTLKMLQPEGDFNVKMPVSEPSFGAKPSPDMPPLRIRLVAAADGRLADIVFGQRSLGDDFGALNHEIRQIVGQLPSPGDAGEAEVELECDFSLKYKHVIDAVTAVSGYRDDHQIRTLIKRVRFAPPRHARG